MISSTDGVWPVTVNSSNRKGSPSATSAEGPSIIWKPGRSDELAGGGPASLVTPTVSGSHLGDARCNMTGAP